MRDLYQILGLGRAATGQDIQRAYRRKAKAAHPDTGGSVEAFSELSTAYTVLSDPHRRQRYDSTGEIELPRADTLDASAFEVIAQKLGLILHAEQDLTALDLGALIEGAIREDMDQRRASIAGHALASSVHAAAHSPMAATRTRIHSRPEADSRISSCSMLTACSRMW